MGEGKGAVQYSHPTREETAGGWEGRGGEAEAEAVRRVLSRKSRPDEEMERWGEEGAEREMERRRGPKEGEEGEVDFGEVWERWSFH